MRLLLLIVHLCLLLLDTAIAIQKKMMMNHLIVNFCFLCFFFGFFFCFPIHFYTSALFAAVEFGQVEKARAILEDNEVDINR